jgi:hypothetical protein
MKFKITDEMRHQAKIESARGDKFVKHHFEVGLLTYKERDELGFLGEINKGQFSLLSKYDIIILGLFNRDQMDYWFPIGFT